MSVCACSIKPSLPRINADLCLLCLRTGSSALVQDRNNFAAGSWYPAFFHHVVWLISLRRTCCVGQVV